MTQQKRAGSSEESEYFLTKYLGYEATVKRNGRQISGEITYHAPNFQIYNKKGRTNLQAGDSIKVHLFAEELLEMISRPHV